VLALTNFLFTPIKVAYPCTEDINRLPFQKERCYGKKEV